MKGKTASTLVLMVLPALALLACPEKSSTSGQPDAGQVEFVEIRVTDDAKHLLFTYLLADGSFETVEKISEIPEEARNQVIVMDTKLSPEKRRSSQILYVADLTEKRKDGTYRYSLVSRFKFERDLLREPATKAGVLPPECRGLIASPDDRIVLYSTEWCGVCKAAANYLKKKGILFEEKDVEKDPAAQKELACKALNAGARLNGVPVLDVAGTLLLGFDRDRIVELSGKLKPSRKKPAANPP